MKTATERLANLKRAFAEHDIPWPDWRPIETAPTGDKDFFLVFGVGDKRNPFVVRGDILKSGRKADAPSILHLRWLTHWMPLPPTPRPEERG